VRERLGKMREEQLQEATASMLADKNAKQIKEWIDEHAQVSIQLENLPFWKSKKNLRDTMASLKEKIYSRAEESFQIQTDTWYGSRSFTDIKDEIWCYFKRPVVDDYITLEEVAAKLYLTKDWQKKTFEELVNICLLSKS